MVVAVVSQLKLAIFPMFKIYTYEKCEMAIAISSSRADSASVPGVAFNV